STLLHLMGALDTPTEGAVEFDGRDMALMSEDEKAAFRNETLGFVFQFHHLLPEFSAVENVAMPALIGGKRLGDVLPDAREILARVGLSERADAKIATLSGGERQRVAIARAVLGKPRVLLADEPTGNLDEHTGARIGALLRELNREMGMTMVIVTHNLELAAMMDRGLELRAGALYEKSFA
ncbi:MAG: ABC transporter ATP-binding protein, partial [Desulfovibrio sp.]|nr:ABC transporter ATP-binding protein [Desulfovibrio sp.]